MANEDKIRSTITSFALAEVSKEVDSSGVDPADSTKRKGWERLREYFRVAAPGLFDEATIIKAHAGITDWCGIFALWAIKTGGVSWVGTWVKYQGISSVPGMKRTNAPQPGDVAAKTEHQHMALVYSVSGDSIQTIDGNNGGKLTGPSRLQSKSIFDAGFYTAFPSPVGRWSVQVGSWSWFYTFNQDGTARWSDIRTPPNESGRGSWEKAGEFLEIRWDIGAHEQWELPLKSKDQRGTLVGQGPIITANKVS